MQIAMNGKKEFLSSLLRKLDSVVQNDAEESSSAFSYWILSTGEILSIQDSFSLPDLIVSPILASEFGYTSLDAVDWDNWDEMSDLEQEQVHKEWRERYLKSNVIRVTVSGSQIGVQFNNIQKNFDRLKNSISKITGISKDSKCMILDTGSMRLKMSTTRNLVSAKSFESLESY